MGNEDSLMDLWNFMGFFEKQRLMQQFREKHGNRYNMDDFVKFLAERVHVLKMASGSVDGKKNDSFDTW